MAYKSGHLVHAIRKPKCILARFNPPRPSLIGKGCKLTHIHFVTQAQESGEPWKVFNPVSKELVLDDLP